MEDEDQRRFESIQRADQFLRKEDFPGTAIRASAKRLAVIREELEVFKVREKRAKHLLPSDGREIRKRCRNLRKEHLQPVSRAAKAIDGFVKHTPGAKAALKVPHITDTAAEHVEAGERLLRFMKNHRAEFLKETKFAPDFLTRLRAATNELREQSQFAYKTRHERSALIRAIKQLLTKGRREIDLLDSLLEPFLIERELEITWKNASRVGRKLGRPRYTPEERAQKRAQQAQRRKERIEQVRLKREQRKQARLARKVQLEEQRKQRRLRKSQPPGSEP